MFFDVSTNDLDLITIGDTTFLWTPKEAYDRGIPTMGTEPLKKIQKQHTMNETSEKMDPLKNTSFANAKISFGSSWG